MIDLGLLRDYPERLSAEIKRKDPYFPVGQLIELDKRVRAGKQEVESLRAEKNELARTAQQGVTPETRERSRSVGMLLKAAEDQLAILEKEFQSLYLFCPNILLPEVPDGGKESNKTIRVEGQRPDFGFTPKNHVELGVHNGWLDFEAAARTSGSHFVLYRNQGVNLVYALALFMFEHNRAYGYSPVLPPYLVNERTLEGASNFPRFKKDVYTIEADNLYLIPTSEVNLTNLYRDAIFQLDELPVRLTAWTSCFRREAGGYGANERGLIRIHQFEKLELYTLCSPEQSAHEQERMLACAEELLKKLGLHYRVTLLAAHDCSFPSAKTYDIEVWIPAQGEYKEVSSVSNCTDFQARRCAIRYRKQAGDKTQLVHTLNASSLALPRVMAALMETYQQEDGTISVPDILRSVTLSF
jgi:seryl-tRNA synthetase